ncbi:hypothetical protein L6452_36757 [Arctium lappa]|uniref:Uncharacterized protein n=1 Tax=Arctium lappa TaxID=4217 RepID=A0ACB8Y0A8_ARCLA|nr:hypothetical protein L6452_36757 [Arctium lappa]
MNVRRCLKFFPTFLHGDFQNPNPTPLDPHSTDTLPDLSPMSCSIQEINPKKTRPSRAPIQIRETANDKISLCRRKVTSQVEMATFHFRVSVCHATESTNMNNQSSRHEPSVAAATMEEIIFTSPLILKNHMSKHYYLSDFTMRIQTSLCLLLVVPFCSSFLELHPLSVSGHCLHDQKLLLLAFKNDLIFDSSMLVGWNQSLDCCDWGGVACDHVGRVTGLDLSNKSITGWINASSSLFGLRFLQTLNLAYNNFNSVQLPSGFGKLTQVTYLNLSNSNIVGQIPADVSLMNKLVTLDLSSSTYNTLVLENPDLKMLLQNVTGLRELHLDNINITTSHGYHWSGVISSLLPNLEVLSLKGCGLSGPLDSSLVKLKYLSVILLDENTFSSDVPESFAYLQNLTVLSIRSCNLSGSLPKKIFQVPTLKIIDLSSNVILAGPLPEFPKNGSLENLVLSYTEVGGTLPDSIGSLRMLSRIELRGCKFTGPLPDSMQNLTRLVYLDLSGNAFTGSIPSFQLSKNLVSVNFYQNNLTGGIPSNWEGLNSLRSLGLGYNSLGGNLPESLLTLRSLQDLDLSTNRLSGQISKIVDVSSYQLRNLDLSSNRFEGPIPGFIFKLPGLSTLTLSANNFTGNIDLDMFGQLQELYALDLSYNNLIVSVNANRSAFSSLSKLNTLKLASCKMQQLPDLKNQSRLMMLDLSDNQLSGEIPNWIWEVGNGYLRFLNLSHNKFSGLEKPYTFPFLLDVLDLHSNSLEGDIPIPPKRVYILDYSSNNFGTSIPVDFGNVLTSTLFFSISSSKLVGVIPQSICNASSLLVLNLYNNSLNGTVPSCLAETSRTLGVLNLGRNNLSGNVLDVFPESCDLKTLDLSGNHLQGPLPQSLVNCKSLEVLDLGDNMITDTFPCWLSNLSNLRVFVIRSNNFHGNMSCLGSNANWTNLQIIDIASNKFSGILPPNLFASLQAIMFDKFANQSKVSYLHFLHPLNPAIYYQDSVTVVLKGQSRELVKILTIFTSIDFSSNSFQGSIPVTIGDLKLLKLLNFSHNAFMGPVPMSIGHLENLESLDLSVNKLSGSIPTQIASLSFLSFLNMSYNQLSGRIPQGSQFQTFTEVSFKGNLGLCGTPLNKSCDNATLEFPTSPETPGDAYQAIDLYVSIGLGFLVGFVFIVGPLVFLRGWRVWYNNQVDRILLRIIKTKDEQTRGEH